MPPRRRNPYARVIRDDAGVRHRILAPPGWRVVRTGALKPGDRYLDPGRLAEGEIVFTAVDAETLGRKPPWEPYSCAGWFEMLIRADAPVRQA